MMMRKAAILAALLSTTLLTAPAFAQQAELPAPSSAWVRAVVEGLDAPTRAEVERRSTGGNHPYEVLRTILLNNLQLADLVQPGQAPLSDVVAIDFVRETAVVRHGEALRAVPFNRATLQIRR